MIIPNTGEVIWLGYERENVARPVELDLRGFLPAGATAELLVQHGDSYYVAATTVEDGVMTWLPTEADLTAAGYGSVQVRAVRGEQVLKTCVMATRISGSIGGTETEPPEVYEGWEETLIAAKDAANTAATSAATAASSANTAASSATAAASAANTAAQRAETAALSAVKGVMVDGTELERDAQQRVDIPLVTRYTTGLLRASDYARIMAVVDNPPVTDISSMSRIVQSLPLADLKTMFKVGDQIIAPWRDLDDNAHSLDYNAYVTAWNIAHVGMVERQDGLTVPGVYLHMHKCSAYGVQYSHQQAFYQAFNAALPSGTYNVTFGVKYNDTFVAGTTGQFTLAQNLPIGGRLLFNGNKVEAWTSATAAAATESVDLTIGTSGTSLGSITSNNERSPDNLNAMHRILYGHGRWLPAGVRQYLNSDKTNYFSSKEDFDIRPNEYAKHGFMAGFNDDFRNAVKPVRVTTALNTVEGYTETTEDTFDTFFLPSLEQMNVQPQLVGAEGETFDYWKQALGSQSFVGTESGNVFDAFKIPAINNNSSQYLRLRSATRNASFHTWFVKSSGYVDCGNYGYSDYRFSPVCVIC